MHTRRGHGSAALVVGRGAGGGAVVRGGLGHQTSASATAAHLLLLLPAHRVDVEVARSALQQRAALGQGCNLSRQGPGSNTLKTKPSSRE